MIFGMKLRRAFPQILIASAFALIPLASIAEVDSKIHELCLNAKDYAGCVKAQSGPISAKGTIGGEIKAELKAKERVKEIYSRIHEFNKRQFILGNPHLKANSNVVEDKIKNTILIITPEDIEGLSDGLQNFGAEGFPLNSVPPANAKFWAPLLQATTLKTLAHELSVSVNLLSELNELSADTHIEKGTWIFLPEMGIRAIALSNFLDSGKLGERLSRQLFINKTCITRGEQIYSLNWTRICDGISDSASADKNNQEIYARLQLEVAAKVLDFEKEEICRLQGKPPSLCIYEDLEKAASESLSPNLFLLNPSNDDIEVSQGFTYRISTVKQLEIRGSYGRYLTFWGRSENEYQGTSASYNAGNPGTLNCYSNNSGTGYVNNYSYNPSINYSSSGSTNCVRSGYVAPSYTPGTPGGVQRGWFEYELDCIDRTYNRKGDKARGFRNKGWMDVYYDPTARAVADRYCSNISDVPKKY